MTHYLTHSWMENKWIQAFPRVYERAVKYKQTRPEFEIELPISFYFNNRLYVYDMFF